LSGVVLNDIGPELELPGLQRIMSYVGVKPSLETWGDAERITRAVNPGFKMTDTEWEDFTKRIYRDVDGKPVLNYDQTLGLSFKSLKPKTGAPIPTFWKLFDSLRHLPLLIIRGEHSDLFSKRVMQDMAISHGNAETFTVKKRGHAPFLDEAGVLTKIISLLKKS
jgi:pimeloyl-ACP methyl ester carboxylesterase